MHLNLFSFKGTHDTNTIKLVSCKPCELFSLSLCSMQRRVGVTRRHGCWWRDKRNTVYFTPLLKNIVSTGTVVSLINVSTFLACAGECLWYVRWARAANKSRCERERERRKSWLALAQQSIGRLIAVALFDYSTASICLFSVSYLAKNIVETEREGRESCVAREERDKVYYRLSFSASCQLRGHIFARASPHSVSLIVWQQWGSHSDFGHWNRHPSPRHTVTQTRTVTRDRVIKVH